VERSPPTPAERQRSCTDVASRHPWHGRDGRTTHGRCDTLGRLRRATPAAKTVTYDFHRMMEGATKLKCSEFGDAIIKHMTT